jgi:transposase-like protein
LEYKYNACQPGIAEMIIQQTLNGSGVRDISGNLQINKNTVVSVLKKNAKNEPLLSYKNGMPATECGFLFFYPHDSL